MSLADRWNSYWRGRLDPALADSRDENVQIANALAAARLRIDDLTHERDLLKEVSAECLRREAQAVRDRDDLLDLRSTNEVMPLIEGDPNG